MNVDQDRDELRADCSRCFGLCCVVPAFAASTDFAINKPAGQPCPNLSADSRCEIHAELRPRGFTGCTVYDCFGAGQRVAQLTFGGRDWHQHPDEAPAVFDTFGVVRQLHELLWYLTDALDRPAAAELCPELEAAYRNTRRLAEGTKDSLRSLDISGYRDELVPLLRRTSELVRTATPGGPGRDLRGCDLIGADLRNADLRGADLRGAYLIAADLNGADLTGADVIGADFRNIDLCGANLSGSLFLTQFQVNAARGDGHTNLPTTLTRPSHWPPR